MCCVYPLEKVLGPVVGLAEGEEGCGGPCRSASGPLNRNHAAIGGKAIFMRYAVATKTVRISIEAKMQLAKKQVK